MGGVTIPSPGRPEPAPEERRNTGGITVGGDVHEAPAGARPMGEAPMPTVGDAPAPAAVERRPAIEPIPESGEFQRGQASTGELRRYTLYIGGISGKIVYNNVMLTVEEVVENREKAGQRWSFVDGNGMAVAEFFIPQGVVWGLEYA